MRQGQDHIGSFRLGLDEDETSVTRTIDSFTRTKDSAVTSVLLSLLAAPASHSNPLTAAGSRAGLSYEGRDTEISTASTISSRAEAVLALLAAVTSHSSPVDSSAKRIVALLRNSNSHTGAFSGDVTTIITLGETTNSHTKSLSSFTYNERTSLELINHQLYWDDGEAAWYTNWFKEWKVLGTEDLLALRGLVTPDAKEPAARVIVQYDETGNGNIDAESEPLETGHDEQVFDVEGVPVDPDGWYRLKITEYSGYNSLYDIDFGIINE
jgi:hypothetical protein